MTDASPGIPPAKTSFVEAGGIEVIPLDKRRGSPWQLFATWTAPNLEFATIFVGVIAVLYFGLNFWQAVAAILLGNFLGALTQGYLSTWGPKYGLAQMVLGRSAFGYRGNILPSALMTVMAGVGWFAVNSVSGAFALATLTGMPVLLGLLIVVVAEVAVAFVGHHLVQIFERYATVILGIIFIIAAVVVLAQANPEAPALPGSLGGFAGFTLAAGAACGYTAGWNPYAADYTRYLSPGANLKKVGWAAGLGDFVSCTALMIIGAASVTIGYNGKLSPTDAFTSHMPGWVAAITLLAIAVGAVSANVLNIYSGAMSFLAMGVKIPFSLRRAIVALGFGVVGFFVAWSALADAGHNYENFLLVIAYWIAPWLGVVLVDYWLRRGTDIGSLLTEKRRYRNIAGVVALVVGLVVSIVLFSNQSFYTGFVPKAWSAVGDLTIPVGFIVSAVVYYVVFRRVKPVLGQADGATAVTES
ncbi:MAG: purine-cytosine permease family protein [Lacisediminihabitans sp.]